MDTTEKVFRKAAEYDTSQYLSDIAYFLCGDKNISSKISSCILAAVRWVVAMDYYNETGDHEYNVISKKQLVILYKSLNEPQRKEFDALRQSIVDPYWIYEKDIKKKIAQGDVFSRAEVEESILRRSSDAILYAAIVGFFCELPRGIIEVLHIRQAFEDILDCVEDYEEDLKDHEPNIFFLYFLEHHLNQSIWPSSFEEARRTVMEQFCIDAETMTYITELYKKANHVLDRFPIPILQKEIDTHYVLLSDVFGKARSL